MPNAHAAQERRVIVKTNGVPEALPLSPAK